MMLSVMVVGAGAAFSDQSKIKNTEAVDACTALNIIGGYPDGSFKPEGNITRAEVTKMICVALNGGKNPAVSTNTTPTFSDVRTNANSAWAEGYIESCAAQGIVSGVGGGKFAPNGNVTGVQLAKMLLVSLGYKSENEGFTGNAWATNVNVRAAQKGLYDGLEKMDTNAAITRDNAAQMVWNALNAYEVEYKTTLVADKNGQLTSQITVQDKVGNESLKTKVTLLQDKYQAWTNVGTLSEINGKKLSITMDNDDKSASDSDNLTFSDLDKDYSALLGQKVKVLFKNGKTNDVIGVYATDDNDVLLTTTASKLDTVSGETKIKVDGTKYSVDTEKGLSVWTISVDANGKGKLDKNTVTGKKTVADIKDAIKKINDNDMAVTVISNNNDNKVDVILVNQKSFVKLTTVNSSSVSYKAVQADMKGNVTGTAIKLDLGNDTPELYKGYAKDDYAFVGADLYNENLVFTKADTVTGKCESFKDDSIKLNGTWYDYILTGSNKYTAKSGKSYTAYVYGGYAYYLSGENGSSSDVDTLLVKTVGDYKKMDKGVETKVYFEDGKDAQVINVKTVVVPKAGFDQDNYDKDADNNGTSCAVLTGDAILKGYKAGQQDTATQVLTPNTLYAYEKDGSDYTLFVLNTNYTCGDVKAYTSDVKYNDKSETINSMEAEDSAPIYLTYSTDTYKVITGSALKGYKAMTGSTNSVYLADNDNVIAAYFNLGKSGISSTDTLYGVVKKSYKGTESNGTDTVVYLDLVTSKGIKTVETEETNNKFTKGMIVSFTGSYEKANDDVEIVSNTQTTSGSVASQGYIAISNNWSDSSKLIRPHTDLYYGNDKLTVSSAKVVSDSTVIYIDEDGYVVDEGTPSKAEELANANGYYANAFVIVNSDNEIDLLVYETGNRIKDGDNKEVQLLTQAGKDAKVRLLSMR